MALRIETAKLSIEIQDSTIDAIMKTALREGVQHWCKSSQVKNKDYRGTKFASESLSKGATLILLEKNEPAQHELTREMLINGIKLFIKNNPIRIDLNTFNQDIAHMDANSADKVVQYAIFERILFARPQ